MTGDARHESETPQLENRRWMERKLRSLRFVEFDRFTTGEWGYHADGRPTCEVAECEACDVMWGKYTGFEGLEEAK